MYQPTLLEYALYLRAMLWCTCTSSIILCLVNCYFFICILFYGTSFLVLNETLPYKPHGAVKFIWIKTRVFCKNCSTKPKAWDIHNVNFKYFSLHSRSKLYYSAILFCLLWLLFHLYTLIMKRNSSNKILKEKMFHTVRFLKIWFFRI